MWATAASSNIHKTNSEHYTSLLPSKINVSLEITVFVLYFGKWSYGVWSPKRGWKNHTFKGSFSKIADENSYSEDHFKISRGLQPLSYYIRSSFDHGVMLSPPAKWKIWNMYEEKISPVINLCHLSELDWYATSVSGKSHKKETEQATTAQHLCRNKSN